MSDCLQSVVEKLSKTMNKLQLTDTYVFEATENVEKDYYLREPIQALLGSINNPVVRFVLQSNFHSLSSGEKELLLSRVLHSPRTFYNVNGQYVCFINIKQLEAFKVHLNQIITEGMKEPKLMDEMFYTLYLMDSQERLQMHQTQGDMELTYRGLLELAQLTLDHYILKFGNIPNVVGLFKYYVAYVAYSYNHLHPDVVSNRQQGLLDKLAFTLGKYV